MSERICLNLFLLPTQRSNRPEDLLATDQGHSRVTKAIGTSRQDDRPTELLQQWVIMCCVWFGFTWHRLRCHVASNYCCGRWFGG